MAERKPAGDPILVENDEQLLRVVRDVVETNEAATVDVEDVGEVVISPAPRSASRRPSRRMTSEELEAKRDRDFYSALGSWKGVDADKMWAEIKAARSQKSRSWTIEPDNE